MLEAHELYRFYHTGAEETVALRGVSFSLAPGEIVAIAGPSGSGKSTLLSCLTGLDEPSGGYVIVNGERITWRRETERARIRARNFGILPQYGNLIAHLSVHDNLVLQCAIAGKPASDIERLLAAVGLERRAGALPLQLSGGEAARAGLAAALAADPPILIADEPTAEVDQASERKILTLVVSRRAAGKTSLIATHSEALARQADRTLRLRDGKIADD